MAEAPWGEILSRLDGMDRKFDSMDKKFDRMDSKFEEMGQEIRNLEESIDGKIAFRTQAIHSDVVRTMELKFQEEFGRNPTTSANRQEDTPGSRRDSRARDVRRQSWSHSEEEEGESTPRYGNRDRPARTRGIASGFTRSGEDAEDRGHHARHHRGPASGMTRSGESDEDRALPARCPRGLPSGLARSGRPVENREPPVRRENFHAAGGLRHARRGPHHEQPQGPRDESDDEDGRRNRRRGRETDRDDGDLKGIKFNLPTFLGGNDPNEFIEWRDKIELIFDCHRYTDQKKVQLAVCEFKGYALTWWQTINRTLQRQGVHTINSWEELLRAMEKRFIPPHHKRDLHHRLQSLYQGVRTVEEFFKEMKMLMMRLEVDEDEEETMARFCRGA